MINLKKLFKGILIICAVFFVFVALLLLMFLYVTKWRLTEVGREASPDGRYELLFQAKGEADWPFGNSHARVTLSEGKEIITRFDVHIADDGASFRQSNYSVEWYPAGAVVTFTGSEQADEVYELLFDGSESFGGYTKEEASGILKDRYGINIENITLNGDMFRVHAGRIAFFARNKLSLQDSYPMEAFKTITDRIFQDRIQRSVEWREQPQGDDDLDKVYQPVIYLYGGSQDITLYCSDVCDWLSFCLAELPYEKFRKVYTGFIPNVGGVEHPVFYYDSFLTGGFDREGFYRALYIYVDQQLSAMNTVESRTEEYVSSSVPEYDDSTIEAWADIEEDCAYSFADGRVYKMVPVDRALGSSYYVLLLVKGEGKDREVELINPDPFIGSGGEASWLKFLDDGKLGFSCLTYNGGDDALFFRTEDGGEHYQLINYPSAMVELPDGTIYNPFVIPADVWEEDGSLFMTAAQGANGDYHGKDNKERVAGLYESKDNGKTFVFVRETAVGN
ncbi:MAG: hypothetical protein J6O71_02225 [Lachnospiraceae bacterium]|nr:hypothetical protein [Lachnospiraceae bacterium]